MHDNSNLDLEAHHSNNPSPPDLTPTKSTTPTQKQHPLTTTLSRTLSLIRTRDSIDPGPPPDGGWTAWSMALLTHLVIFNTWGFINSFGLFQTYYVDVMRLGSDSEVSWIGSVQVFIIFGIGTFSGRATDAGYFRATFVVGSVLYLVGIFMMSLSQTYWQVFLAQGVCVAVGNGLVFVPSVALVSTYFARNRGKALGVLTAGSATGGLVFPVCFNAWSFGPRDLLLMATRRLQRHCCRE
jgi:Major Facilitator Superfamily